MTDEVTSRAMPVSGWQLIETAPKDGTRIDIWAIRQTTGEASRYTDCIWGRRHYGTEPYGEPVWLGLQDPHSKITPTHWMPQPGAPVPSENIPTPSDFDDELHRLIMRHCHSVMSMDQCRNLEREILAWRSPVPSQKIPAPGDGGPSNG